jgi:hypothetical protein
MIVKHFYEGKSVLITGATGFIGKVVLEKLLRDIPNIGTIYIIVRRYAKVCCVYLFHFLLFILFFGCVVVMSLICMVFTVSYYVYVYVYYTVRLRVARMSFAYFCVRAQRADSCVT